MEFVHIPVLFEEIIENLNIRPNGIYVDATFGGGGHSSEILKKMGEGLLIGIDQDLDAIANAKKKFEKEIQEGRLKLVHGNFEQIEEHLQALGIEKIDGIIADLGVSSYQLDTGERGFSYQFEHKLDMRMNQSQDLSAYHVVNEYGEEELARIIKDYGEERWAKRIAAFIVKFRQQKRIETTFELVDIIKAAIPKEVRRDGSHPAKKTFQAIRIEVNAELDRIERFINSSVNALNTGGRIEIITFHSLEDRIVKNAFKNLLGRCTCPKEFPVCVCNSKGMIKLVNNKPIVAGERELAHNNRSRSAKLRIAQRI